MRRRAKFVATAVVIVSSGFVLLSGPASAEDAIVTRVVDGDTVDVRIDGRSQRVRLLNVDAPETKHPERGVECLGPEAEARLKTLLPPGTSVTLQYDEVRTDRYGRTLAAVINSEGVLVNREMARRGLGMAVAYGDNDKFLPDVQAGQKEAISDARGLYAPSRTCTLPGQVAEVARAVEAAQPPASAAQMSVGDLEGLIAQADAAATAAGDLLELLAVGREEVAWSALPAERRAALGRQVVTLAHTARIAQASLRSAAADARTREASAARAAAAARAVAARAAAAKAVAARVAAAKEAALRAPAAAPPVRPRREAPRTERTRSSSEGTHRDNSSSSTPNQGYTGPRCYAPGGKTWKPC